VGLAILLSVVASTLFYCLCWPDDLSLIDPVILMMVDWLQPSLGM